MLSGALFVFVILIKPLYSFNNKDYSNYVDEFRSFLKDDGNATVTQLITYGPILGNIAQVGNNTAEIYNSVPYGKPPIGELRFEKPERLSSWKSPVNTTRIIECWQISKLNFLSDDEDCLYFKIVIPLDSTGKRFVEKLPAIFWVHGGSFHAGSKEMYKLQAIVEHFSSKKIIFIAPNYRLGVLGFMSSLHLDMPGNYGLEDILLALSVVRENANNFGIDVDRITLAGESAGAMSASILAVSPRTKGQISSLYLNSGSSQSIMSTRSLATKVNSEDSIETCNCTRDTVKESKNCMKTAGYACLFVHRMEYYRSVMDGNLYDGIRMKSCLFTPVIDSFRGNESIISKDITELVGQEARVPILISGVRNEFTSYNNATLRTCFQKRNCQKNIDNLLAGNTSSFSRELVIQAIRKKYRIDESNNAEIEMKLYLLTTDEFRAAFYKEAILYARRGQRVYLLENNVTTDSAAQTKHGMDMMLIFNNSRFANDPREKRISQRWTQRFSDILTEFILTSKINSLSPFTDFQRNAYEISASGVKLIDHGVDEYHFWYETIPFLEQLQIDSESAAQLKKSSASQI